MLKGQSRMNQYIALSFEVTEKDREDVIQHSLNIADWQQMTFSAPFTYSSIRSEFIIQPILHQIFLVFFL